jgi:hypothetical protein
VRVEFFILIALEKNKYCWNFTGQENRKLGSEPIQLGKKTESEQFKTKSNRGSIWENLGVLKLGRMYLGECFFEADRERERQKTYEGVYSRYLAMGKS